MEEARRLAPPWASGCPCGVPTAWWAAGSKPLAAPAGGVAKGLHLLNSFTHAKQPFAPLAGNRVGWYICGPTVYDASHLGHARNYVSFDVLRRVMTGYFGCAARISPSSTRVRCFPRFCARLPTRGLHQLTPLTGRSYDVMFVENVTDIDDKIILRAHVTRAEQLVETVRRVPAALWSPSERVPRFTPQARAALERWTASGNSAEAEHCSVLLQPVTAALAAGEKSVAALGAATSALAAAFQASSWDVQEEYLTLARRFEREFFEDMDALGVQRPDVVTRVSEFVPQVVSYIQAIIDKGAPRRTWLTALTLSCHSPACVRRLGLRVAGIRLLRRDGLFVSPAALLREAEQNSARGRRARDGWRGRARCRREREAVHLRFCAVEAQQGG